MEPVKLEETMFTPQTIRIEVGDGTEVFIGNSPHDDFWRIRSRHLLPRIHGIADFECLGHSLDGRAHVTDVGLSLQSGALPLLNGWEDRTFHSAQEAKEFVRQSGSRQS
jgi:hypothetical protein